jgi:lipid-A-disaccharide synthase
MPEVNSPLVMLVAGEDSGDRHAAALFMELKKLMPSVRAIGMGGPRMREAGIEIVQDNAGLAVIGVAEVVRHYFRIRGILHRMQAIVVEQRPDLLICVDYKEFNFHLARYAKSQGLDVLFYVGPQFWAWRPGRVHTYARAVSHMAVIFPFEVAHYCAAGVPVTYVGHPLAGAVRPTRSVEQARRDLGLAAEERLIGLLPGSRVNEISRLLPLLIASAERVSAEVPGVRFVLARSPSMDVSLITRHTAKTALPIRMIEGIDYDILQCCDAVITSSGTATLEVALLGVPMVVVYRLAPISYWLGRLLVSIPYIALPNILSGRAIVREFIQHEATDENVATELVRILSDQQYAQQMRQDLRAVRDLLGPGGGSANLARLAGELLQVKFVGGKRSEYEGIGT